jgi:TRAP-type mannitol/chloroaromatic compound transport system permease small subunit
MDRLLGRVSGAMNALGSALILFIMAVMVADIVGRAVFARPLKGVPEMVTIAITIIVFLQFASTLRAGRMIMIDGFIDWLARRSVAAEQALLGLYHLAGALVFGAVGWATVPLMRRVLVSGDVYGNIGVFTFPKWPVRVAIIAGCALVALEYLLRAVAHWRCAARGTRLDAGGNPRDRILS